MNLKEYVQGLQRKGYSKEQIVSYLKKYGYPEQSILDCFADPLENYVLTYLRQGYTPDQMYTYLSSRGYDTQRLQKIFSTIDTQYYNGKMPLQVIHKHDISTGSVVKVGAMLLVLVMVVGAGILFVPGLFQKKLLDVEATAIDNSLKQGDTLRFDVVVISQGTSGRVDMNFMYTIRNEDGLLVERESDTRAVDTTLRYVKEIQLPDVLPSGTYTVDVLAQYEDLQPTPSMFTFEIKNTGQPSEPTIDPTDGPDDDVLEDDIEDSKNSSPPPKIPVVVITPTDSEKDDQAYLNDALDSSTRGEAIGNCNAITDEFLKDECKILIARQYDDAVVCDEITTQTRKENCYMDFVLAGQTELCENVHTISNKQLCAQFSVMYSSTPNIPEVEHTTPPEGYTPTIDELDVTDVLE